MPDLLYFLDTNIIIRFLTKDNPTQAKQSLSLFQQLENGTRTALTSEAVIIEAVHILSSKTLYHLPRNDISKHLTNILFLKGIKITHKKTILSALELYSNIGIDFVDCLIAAYMKRMKLKHIFSFDKDFDEISFISRHEPQLTKPLI